MVLLLWKFTPPSSSEIAKAGKICSLLVYSLGEKPTITIKALALNLDPNPKKIVKKSHTTESYPENK